LNEIVADAALASTKSIAGGLASEPAAVYTKGLKRRFP
jgi:hypothetical protein